MTTKVCINYYIGSDKDESLGVQLCDDLKKNGVKVFILNNIPPGKDKEIAAKDALDRSAFFLSLISKASLDNDGLHNIFQRYAIDCISSKPLYPEFIIPILIDDCEAGYKKLQYKKEFQDIQYVKIDDSYAVGLNKILKKINDDKNIHNVGDKPESDDIESAIKKIKGINTHNAIQRDEDNNIVALNLDGARYDDFPIIIFKAEKLEKLSLADNNLGKVPSSIGDLKSLKELILFGNDLTILPDEIGGLFSLEHLDIGNNQLEKVPSSIGNLKSLKKLILFGNDLTTLPDEIGGLFSLEHLDIGNNQLKEVPSSIGNLERLKKLILVNNELKTLPDEIGSLNKLEDLALGQNGLESIPSSITSLKKSLKTINLSDNKISILPEAITGLTDLVHLNISNTKSEDGKLSDNSINTLPISIKNLTKLKRLFLNYNQLNSLPKEIGCLKRLNTLQISGNNLRKIPNEIGLLEDLESLTLDNNYLESLPCEIGKLRKLAHITADGNQFKRPLFDLFNSEGSDDQNDNNRASSDIVKNYLEHLNDDQDQNIREVRMILLGKATSCKTWIASELSKSDQSEFEVKNDIGVLNWVRQEKDGKKTTIRIMDIGEQAMDFDTYKILLSNRLICLIFCELAQSVNYQEIDNWLSTIKAQCDCANIILILYRTDKKNDPASESVLEERYKNEVAKILKVTQSVPKEYNGIGELKDEIMHIVGKITPKPTVWISPWLIIREYLENECQHWIRYDDFLKSCLENKLGEGLSDSLMQYLRYMGTIIYYPQRLLLRNFIILDTDWIIRTINKVFKAESVHNSEGILEYKDLNRIWGNKEYDMEIVPKLIELMEYFDLAYELPDKTRFLIPECLPSNPPKKLNSDDWKAETGILRFCYIYKYLLKEIIIRFIVTGYPDIKPKTNNTKVNWKEGAVIKWEESEALVEFNKETKRINISIKGLEKRELLAVIRNKFSHIHSSLNPNPKPIEGIPCSTEKCNRLFEYEMLLKQKENNYTTVYCDECKENIHIQPLLGEIKTSETPVWVSNKS